MAALFAQALPMAFSDRFGLADESPESWQGGVGTLTPKEPLPTVCATQEGGEPSADSLIFSLRAGDLGELKCRVQRGETGVVVLIGMDGQNALSAAGAERGALEAALRATGLTVESVSVVTLAKFGTTLARGGGAPTGRPVRQVHAGLRGSSRSARRVKLIG